MAFIKTFPCCSATFFPLKANSGGCEVEEICNNYEEGLSRVPFALIRPGRAVMHGPQTRSPIGNGLGVGSSTQAPGRGQGQRATALRTGARDFRPYLGELL